MPVTVTHALSMTTPDDPAYENKPSNWNETHAATLSIAATEISGLFSNANGVSFGLSESSITASTVLNVFAENGEGIVAGTALIFRDSGGVAFGIDQFGGGIRITASAPAGLTAINISAGTTSNNLSALTFANGNGVSFGINASTLTASIATSLTNIRLSAGTTSNLLSAVTFSNANGVSFGLDAGTITASHNALTSQSNQNVTAGNGGFAFETLSFSNANGISFGTSAGSAITGSHNAITTARASTDGIGLNTAQTNVTWTVNSSGVSLNAAGYAGTGTSATNASVTLNSNGLAISVAAPGGGAGATLTSWSPDMQISVAGSNAANSSVSLCPFRLDQNVSASQFACVASVSAATAANTSSAGFRIGVSAVIYTKSGATLSSLNSGSMSTSTFHQSNSTLSVANQRMFTFALATASAFTPGQYWLALHVTTTTSGQTSLAKGLSMAVVPTWHSGLGVANYLGANTTNTRGVGPGRAIHSTGATRASIAFSDITGHGGNSASIANLWFALRDDTVW